MLSHSDYHYLYKMTEEITPVSYDCGTLCNSICCQPGEKETLGIYLFPGEREMLSEDESWFEQEICSSKKHFFPSSWPKKVYFIKCISYCPRHLRPLACRFFPLATHLNKNNDLLLIYETISLPYNCPLIYNKVPLLDYFVDTVARCWEYMIAADSRIREFVIDESRKREMKQPDDIEIIWHQRFFR